jgi:hemerythrin superfamily protein
MADVFDVLGRDHTEVKRMFTELEAGASRQAPPGDEELRLRKKRVEHLIIEESKHEAVEQEYFWPTVRELVPEGDGLADRAVGQEQEAKQLLNDLRHHNPGDDRFEELLASFITDARDHISFEENHVWPELRRVISQDRAEALGRQLEEGKKRAPTRPHPNTPPKPGVLKGAGAAVAMADRVLDKVTGRGRG